jgi:hypothetical protein
MSPTQQCPLCHKSVYYQARYPDYICQGCLTLHGTLTRSGKTITFSNVDFYGGFMSQVEGETEIGDTSTCYVNGVRCSAQEARFGGIVVSPDPDSVGACFP